MNRDAGELLKLAEQLLDDSAQYFETLYEKHSIKNIGIDPDKLRSCAERLRQAASQGSASVAQAQTGCGDPSCKDPNCTYGSGPTEAQIERGRQAVRDEYGSKLCFWAEDGTRHCRIEADQLCMCAEIATHCLSAAIPSASSPAQAVRDPWANAIDPDARTPGDDLGPSELIRIELRQAMLDCWNSICADTDCHPLDIKHQGKKLFFTPDHWADMVSWELSCRLSHHASMRDLISSGGLPEASPVPSASRGTEA